MNVLWSLIFLLDCRPTFVSHMTPFISKVFFLLSFKNISFIAVSNFAWSIVLNALFKPTKKSLFIYICYTVHVLYKCVSYS